MGNWEESKRVILFGFTVAVISSALQSLGITLQRKSYTTQYHPRHQKNRRTIWLIGFFLFIFSNIIGSLIQLTTLPLIILSPSQSIGLIFNSIFSCVLLPEERFTKKLTGGTILIALGAFVIALNGATPPVDEGHDAKERFHIIVSKLEKRSFALWFGSTVLMILMLLIVNYFILLRGPDKGINGVRRQKMYDNMRMRIRLFKGLNYGIISGTLTAHTFLFAKSLVDVAVQTILNNGHDLKSLFDSKNITPYCLLLIMLLIICFQLTAFNLGLKELSTSILYPLCFLVFNLINLINDLIYNSLLSEGRMSFGCFLFVVFGLLMVFIGVVVISWDSAFGHNTIQKEPVFPYSECTSLLGSSYKLNDLGCEFSYEQSMLLDLIGL